MSDSQHPGGELYMDAEVPDPPLYHLDRPRLFELLDAGANGPLTLVSAPAGGGKTVLVSSWARSGRSQHPVVWMSAAEPDVWTRLAAKLADNGLIGEPADIDDVMRKLDGVRTPVVVVLDDVDTADPRLLAGIESLTDRGRGQLHLVVGSRVDPPLPLLRWRMRGVLTQLTAAELAFSLDEARALLSAHGVALSDMALLDLHGLAEGWPAALRLAALSMQGHPEPERLVPDFALHDRALGEYLMAEVLTNVDIELRDLLLRVSVLDSMTPELVETLTGRTDGAQLLASLEQSNLFVIHCGGKRPWYRFHPLLGLLLYNQLRQRQGYDLPRVHRRAADWYGEHDMPADAIRHALAAKAWDRAAATAESRWQDVLPGARVHTLKGVVPLPPPEALNDPWLILAFAAERMDAGDLSGTTTYLNMIRRSTHQLPQAAAERLDRATMAFRIAEAYQSADPEQILASPMPAFDRIPVSTEDEYVHALAVLALGTADLSRGDLLGAEPALYDALQSARRWGLRQCRMAALHQLAVLNAIRGTLRPASRYAEELLAEVDARESNQGIDVTWAELVLAEVCYQQDRLPAATYHLGRALGACSLGDVAPAGIVAIVRARVNAATTNQHAAAADTLAATRRQLAEGQLLPILAQAMVLVEAELRLASGQLLAARRLLDEISPVSRLSVWPSLVRAKLYLAERRPAAAVGLLTPSVEAGHPSSTWTVEANLVYAQALAAQGDRSGAGKVLERALEVAEEEGIRRPFSSRGRAARDLLATCLPPDSAHRRFADELAVVLRELAAPAGNAEQDAPVESLTDRELTVLRYLQSMMSTAEIASVLYVSVNTVKTHMKSIYRKLGAGRRREAVERARRLRLL